MLVVLAASGASWTLSTDKTPIDERRSIGKPLVSPEKNDSIVEIYTCNAAI
jgi:topoisomerase-4 subunit A